MLSSRALRVVLLVGLCTMQATSSPVGMSTSSPVYIPTKSTRNIRMVPPQNAHIFMKPELPFRGESPLLIDDPTNSDVKVPPTSTDIYDVPATEPLRENLPRMQNALTPARQRESLRLDFGMEYLAHFHVELMKGNSPLIVFSGDSTTEGFTEYGPISGYKIDEITQRIATRRGYPVRTHNSGHSAKQSVDWLTSYLAEDLNMNPDLYVMRWGLNDPYYNTPLTETINNMRKGLESIRSVYPVGSMSLVLMLPNSVTNPEDRRDIAYIETLREPFMELAREFQCAFVDTVGLALDSGPAAVGVWMDSPNGGKGGLHPLRVMNVWIADHLAGLLFPEGLLP